jgi:hypothetical protein
LNKWIFEIFVETGRDEGRSEHISHASIRRAQKYDSRNAGDNEELFGKGDESSVTVVDFLELE